MYDAFVAELFRRHFTARHSRDALADSSDAGVGFDGFSRHVILGAFKSLALRCAPEAAAALREIQLRM